MTWYLPLHTRYTNNSAIPTTITTNHGKNKPDSWIRLLTHLLLRDEGRLDPAEAERKLSVLPGREDTPALAAPALEPPRDSIPARSWSNLKTGGRASAREGHRMMFS